MNLNCDPSNSATPPPQFPRRTSRRPWLFPELAEHLEAAFDAAPEGAEYVVGRYRGGAVNLRTQFEKIIRRAGLTPWPRLMHNLRSSRQTELTDRFPAHVVASWLGNSEEVAKRHYLQTTDEHFAAAVQGNANSDATCVGMRWNRGDSGTQKNEKTRISAGLSRLVMDDTGLEQPAFFAGKQVFLAGGNAKGNVTRTETEANPAERCPFLSRLVTVWPSLTDDHRLAVVEHAERLAGALDAAGGPLSHSPGRVAGSP